VTVKYWGKRKKREWGEPCALFSARERYNERKAPPWRLNGAQEINRRNALKFPRSRAKWKWLESFV